MRRPIILFLLAAAATAQLAPPIFQSETELVQVSVVARDKNGKPVADLKREDFQIFDNGAPQPIRLFMHESGAGNAPEKLPPGIFTNRLASDGQTGYSVILFDNLNIDPANNTFAKTAGARLKALAALREIPTGDKIAIYSLWCQFEVVHEFTFDRDSLVAQLGRFTPAAASCADPGGSGSGSERMTSGLEGTNTLEGIKQRQEEEERRRRSAPAPAEFGLVPAPPPPTLESGDRQGLVQIGSSIQRDIANHEFEELAEHLAGIPGRKNLIWLATSFRLSPANLQRMLNAGVSIYPVDTTGSVIAVESEKKIQAAPLRNIAAMTGGLAYSDRDDLDVAIREALADGRVSYTIGYYRPDAIRETPAHRIEVRVNRPGVTLRYRTSYTVEPPKPVSANGVKDLVDAMNRPVNATSIGMTAGASRRQNMLELAVLIDPSQLGLEQADGLWKGKAEFVSRFVTVDDKVAGKIMAQTVTFNLRPSTYASALRKGLRLKREIPIPPHAVELNLLIANLATGKIGTLTIPVTALPVIGR